jgi:rfaE bifunctional protein kinase chain/domain
MSAAAPDLSTLLDRVRGRLVLIVGDLMLDHFVIGAVDRISPEAPVPVVRFNHDEYRLGGAGNVAHNIAALGGRAEVAGIVGDDEIGSRLMTALRDKGIGTAAVVVDEARVTTRKLRVVTARNQQVARVDYESDAEICGPIEERLVQSIREAAARCDAVLVSDYLKGVVTRAVARAAIDGARTRRVPCLIDPKVPHIDFYAGASLVTPNHHEAEAVTLMRLRTSADAAAVARAFRERAGCDSVLITRGEHGMWLLGPDGEHDLPAEAREVSDVTGAGDTVIAAIALGLAGGGSLADAARLANKAAGLAVSRFGPAAISAQELKGAL